MITLWAIGMFICGGGSIMSFIGMITAFFDKERDKEFTKAITTCFIIFSIGVGLLLYFKPAKPKIETKPLYKVEYVIYDPSHNIRQTIYSEYPLKVEVYNEIIGFFGTRTKTGYRLIEDVANGLGYEKVDSFYPIEITKQERVR